MAAASVPDLDLARIRRFCESRVPAQMRDQVRVEAGVRGRSVTIFDCRPPWQPDGGPEWSRQPIAQLRYDADTHRWSLYWADRNSRWHQYEELEPGPVDDLLGEIDRDPTAIFWG